MTTQPNLLFIVTDHQAYYGHDRPGEYRYQWPRYENFASQGVRFDRAYSICPLCSPARASMMSGVYPSSHGLRWNTEVRHSFNRPDFRPGQLLYSHYLAQAGYRNAYVGKWHAGHERLPIDYGIEGWSLPDYGKIYMSEAYEAYAAERGLGEARVRVEYNLNHPEWNGQTVTLHDPSPWKFMNGTGILEGPPEAHEEQFVAHLAVEKLRELSATNQPFSLVASFWGPHQAYYPSEPFAGMVDPASIPEYPSFQDDLAGRPFRHMTHREISHRSAAAWPDWSTWQQILARCYEQGFQTDAAIGQILDTLDELGLADNTMVIWCADHGDAVASHGGLWDKASTCIEEVMRVPMAIRWPDKFDGGQRSQERISNMDITATLLDAAGVTVPEEMHSRSLLSLCTTPEQAEWPEHLVCEHHGHGHIIPQRMIVNERYKYVAALFDMDELYDLEADPFEMNNLLDDPVHATILAGLREQLIDHLRTYPEPEERFTIGSVRSLLLALENER